MTVPSRGAKSRRDGRRPGWQLLSALLVLAILASSTLVFTNRVELLRLAVILALWAAVVAAFVSVIYRRQSDVDQARARDMKYVYDLQLDREISARREYELSVEAHLRRQLARELRAHGDDEMAALRAELASLRSHLEAMFGTDLADRPALEGERIVMAMPAPLGRVESSRVTEAATAGVAADRASYTKTGTEIAHAAETVDAADIDAETAVAENPIIDVPEEPLDPEPAEPAVAYPGPPPPKPRWQPPEPPDPPRRGRHWTDADSVAAPRGEPVSMAAGPGGRHGVGSTDRNPATAGPPPGVQDPAEAEPHGQHTGGHSVADLMARLEVNGPAGSGGRRRRKD